MAKKINIIDRIVNNLIRTYKEDYKEHGIPEEFIMETIAEYDDDIHNEVKKRLRLKKVKLGR